MKTKADKTRQTWAFSEVSRNVHRLQFDLNRVGDQFRILLQSDVHWDNPKCDRPLLKRHLDEAKAIGAPVMDAGDFFCAMQGKYDPRASKKDIRPEHNCNDYLDALVNTADHFLAPYSDILTLRGHGNHETAILKRHESDLTNRLVKRLKIRGSNACLGGYSGFVVISVSAFASRRFSFKLHYNHGTGGGGPVTRGVIQTNRQAVYLADADIVWNGHTHDSWQVPIQRIRLSQDFAIEETRQLHIRTSGYKNDWGNGLGGFAVERGHAPKPRGAAWLTFRLVQGSHVQFTVEEAI